MTMTIHGNLSPVPPPSPTSVGPAGPPPKATPEAAGVDRPAPTGVTPELWNALSTDEQAYFSAAPVRGPLVYGRTEASAVEPAAQRGQRIDVRA